MTIKRPYYELEREEWARQERRSEQKMFGVIIVALLCCSPLIGPCSSLLTGRFDVMKCPEPRPISQIYVDWDEEE
jgi:hypothetical protein